MGLLYYGARYYDPLADQFVSADSVQGNSGGMNPYGYVGGNPETFVDPTGHMECDDAACHVGGGGTGEGYSAASGDGTDLSNDAPLPGGSVTDGNTTYEYDPSGNDITVTTTNPDGSETSTTYTEGEDADYQQELDKVEALENSDLNSEDLQQDVRSEERAQQQDEQKPTNINQPTDTNQPIDTNQPTDTNQPGVPPPAEQAANYAEANNGAAQPGYVGNQPFANDGRGGGQVLPQTTPDGQPITYREYDVNPQTPGVRRDALRVVIGSDGGRWYTDDHYYTFTGF